jgi:xylulokinase
MSRPPLLAGLDVGTSRVKAVVVDAAGREGRPAAAVTTPFVTTAGGVEAEVHDLLDAVGRAVGLLGDDRSRVAGVGVAGLAESGAPVNEQGHPLAPVIAWHDPRGEEVASLLDDRFGDALALAIGQRVRPVSSVAKLGWLLDHGTRGVVRWLGVPELVVRALTGAEATEWSLAARTGCFDVRRREWLPEVAGAAGIDLSLFPEIVGAGHPVGQVTAAAADWCGLPAGVPVTLAGHDHLSGVVGSGAGPDDLANSVGTAETVIGRSPALPDVGPALEAGLAVTLFPGGDGWAVLASGARAGLAVDHAAAALDSSPEELDALAAAGDGVLDAPGLIDSLRRRDPPLLPDGDPGAVWRTLLDALAACTAEAASRVTGLLGPAPRIVVFGGGGRSAPWLAAKARRADLPVWRSGAGEAVARGAAVAAGVGVGWWPSAAEAPAPPVEPPQGQDPQERP